MSNGVLTYLNEAAYGEMKDLIRDVGINDESIHFYNLKKVRTLKMASLRKVMETSITL
jgi:hypothetical protein